MNLEPLREVEVRLEQDAERLREAQSKPIPVSQILQRHQTRSRRNRRARIAAVAFVLIGLPSLWLAIASWRTRTSSPSSIAELHLHQHEPQFPAPRVTRSSPSPPPVSVDEAPTRAVPIVLVRTNDRGEEELVPGLYIPGHSRPVEMSDLNGAQRRAIREVLQLQEEPIARRPI